MIAVNKEDSTIKCTDAVIQTIQGAKPHPALNYNSLQQDKKRHPTDMDGFYILPFNGAAIVELKKPNGKFSIGQDILFGGMVNVFRMNGNKAYYLKCEHTTKRGVPINPSEVYILEEINGVAPRRKFEPGEYPLQRWLTEHKAVMPAIKFPYMFQAPSQGIIFGSWGYDGTIDDMYIERAMHWIVDEMNRGGLTSRSFFMEGGEVRNREVDLATSRVIRVYGGDKYWGDPDKTVFEMQEGFQNKHSKRPPWRINEDGMRC